MENEGDVVELLLQGDELEVPQLGCIDELMNNTTSIQNDNQMIADDIIIDDVPLDQLGFDQAVAETNNEAIIQEEEFDGILERFKQQCEMNNDHVSPDLAGDHAAISIRRNLVSDTVIFTPPPGKMTRKKPCTWTKKEHRQFKRALEDGLKGEWKQVSEIYIPSKTASQITSHAQKYFKRKNNTHKKRKSINDDDTSDDDDHAVNTINHHQQQLHLVHDPSSSSSSCSLSMVNNYHQMCIPVQSDQISTPLPPLMTPPPMSTHMHGNGNGNGMNMMMPPPAVLYYVAALYYKCLHLEKQILKLRRGMMMMMTMPHNNRFLPGPDYSTSNGASTFGVINQPLQPYVGSTSHHHDAYYYNAPLDHHQSLQPHEPLVQQITNHPHQGGDPPNHAYY